MKIYNNLEQGSTEWHDVRAGKLTASTAQPIATAGRGLETLVYEIMALKYSSGEYDSYKNADMERGNELEASAAGIYEMETGKQLEVIGFAELNEYVGCSPDRQIKGENGGVEIKCKKDSKYLRALIEKKIDKCYIWQMQMQMLVMGWDFVDFVDYNPNFTKNINITRIKKDKKMQEKLEIGIVKGIKLIKEIGKNYKKITK